MFFVYCSDQIVKSPPASTLGGIYKQSPRGYLAISVHCRGLWQLKIHSIAWDQVFCKDSFEKFAKEAIDVLFLEISCCQGCQMQGS